MDVHGARLADAVEAADALFKDFRIAWQAEQNEVAGELEIATFTADFRADENARAFGIGEPCGVAIALKQREILVKQGGFHMDLREQFFLHRDGGFRRTGDK